MPPAFPVFGDPTHPLKARVEDLLSRLTLAEKIGQLMHDSPAVERLGVPAYNWWNEACHGIGRNGRATVFPQVIGLGATWNRALLQRGRHGDLRRGARQAPRRRGSGPPRPVPGAHVLDAEHQYLPRPPLGARPGDLRRGSVPHRRTRRRHGARPAGRPSPPAQDRRLRQAFRRAQRPRGRTPRLRCPAHAQGSRGNLSARLRKTRARRRRGRDGRV